MRLKNFLNEDIVKQALDLPEPETGGDYPSEKVKRYLDMINKALEAMKKKEENDANDAIVADLRDKKEKWSNIDKETKPVKLKPSEPPTEKEPAEPTPPEEKEPPPEKEPPQEEPPPEEEEKDQEEIGPDQPKKKKKKKKKKIGEEKYSDMLFTPFEKYMTEQKIG